jgi:hypothetical protein
MEQSIDRTLAHQQEQFTGSTAIHQRYSDPPVGSIPLTASFIQSSTDSSVNEDVNVAWTPQMLGEVGVQPQLKFQKNPNMPAPPSSRSLLDWHCIHDYGYGTYIVLPHRDH